MSEYRDYDSAFQIFCESVDSQFFAGAGEFLADNYSNEFQEAMDEYFEYGNSWERDDLHKHFTAKLMEIVI